MSSKTADPHTSVVRICATTHPVVDSYDLWSFGADDAAYLQSITHIPRRRQSIAARVALHQALTLWCGHAPNGWTLQRNAQGRPFLTFGASAVPQQAPYLSLAHSDAYGVAALSHGPCGVDVESHTRTGLARAWERIAAPEERSLVAMMPPPFQAPYRASSWALKEAWTKIHGDGLAHRARQVWLEAKQGAPWVFHAPTTEVHGFHGRLDDQLFFLVVQPFAGTPHIEGGALPWSPMSVVVTPR